MFTNPIEEFEIDPEFSDPNRTYTPPAADPLEKVLEGFELNEHLTETEPLDAYEKAEMAKGLGIDGIAPAGDAIPRDMAEFNRQVELAACRLREGEMVTLFDGRIRVHKVNGRSTWQRIR